MIMSDLAGRKAAAMREHAEHLPEWLRARGDQVWIARDWATLEDLESSPDIRIEGLGWRDDEGSKKLRLGKDATPKQWLDSFKDFESPTGRQIVEDGRKAFLGSCGRIENAMMENHPVIVCQVKSSQCWRTEVARLVKEPIMGHILGLVGDRKYHTQEWNDALERFPDEMAFGRTSRILCWYSLAQAAGKRKVESNDFEDAAYAHAASYTGYLATEDRDLIDMVRAVFENVTIIPKQ